MVDANHTFSIDLSHFLVINTDVSIIQIVNDMESDYPQSTNNHHHIDEEILDDDNDSSCETVNGNTPSSFVLYNNESSPSIEK
jgi:hypothetical protein